VRTYEDLAQPREAPVSTGFPNPSNKPKRHLTASAWLFLIVMSVVLGGIVALFVTGHWFLGAVAVGCGLAIVSGAVSGDEVRHAAPGTVRIETIKAHRVNATLREYTKCGWALENQSSAKSFGTQARVTVTFRKR
jgi:hypothetical protein